MITRTTYSTDIHYTKADFVKHEFVEVKETINGKFDTPEAIEALKKDMQKKFMFDGLVIDAVKSEVRYLSDEEWLKLSHVMPEKTEWSGRGRKPKEGK